MTQRVKGLVEAVIVVAASFGAISASSARLPAQEPGLGSLPRVVLKIPADLKGYYPDAAQSGALQQGLYELPCWVALEDALPRIDGTGPRPAASDPCVARVFSALSDLLGAYRAKSIEPTLALYDEASRPKILRALGDAEARGAWLASVQKVTSFEPALIWQEGARVCCAMRMRMRGDAGEEIVTPFAVMLDRDGRLVAGEMTAPFHANLTRFLADTARRPRELVANYELLRNAESDRSEQRGKS
jgi:hypothetical protein